MSDVAVRIAVAATLVWLGMVLAISFLEAPLKFRAPGLELHVGLAIGRIVFRALNVAEVAWALVIAACLVVDPQSATITTLACVTDALLAIQLLGVRPRLNRRSDEVLARRRAVDGTDAPRSSAHHAYIALETLKVAALIALACFLLAA